MLNYKISNVLLIAGGLFAATLQPAAAQSSGSRPDVTQEIINGVVQNIIQNVRDQLQSRKIAVPGSALRFNGEDSSFDGKDPFAQNGTGNPFAALAYAKAPYMKAPPLVTSSWLYGANLIGAGDRATTFGTATDIQTVTGAFDVTKIGIFSSSDALTFIGTGSNSWSHANSFGFTSDTTTPSTSGTLAYLNGGFSADFTTLASWTSSSLVGIADTSSLSYTGNAQYRFDFPYAVWVEPTAGVTYTEAYSSDFGTKLADMTEVHGGMRIGTQGTWMGYKILPTFTGTGFRIVDASPLAASAVGASGVRGSAKVTVLWTPQFSSYLEGHGTASTSNSPFVGGTQSYGAQAGLRYTWN